MNIKERAKRVPLKIKLYVHFVNVWYDLFIIPDRFHTLSEEKKAHKWAKRQVKAVLNQLTKTKL